MPAAAVIPAPVAYIKVVAVKKLVVGFLTLTLAGPLLRDVCCQRVWSSFWRVYLAFVGLDTGSRSFTLKKLECSKQALCCEYISME